MLETTNLTDRAPAARAHTAPATPSFLARLPRYAYIGLLLNVLAWTSSWARIGPWPYTFFPLWLGFILVLDGLNVARQGASILTRSTWRFAGLFAFSIPCWWVYEILNIPVRNWHYRMDHPYSWLGYHIISSIDFSTVLPVVMEMAELLATFAVFRPRLWAAAVGPRMRTGWAAAEGGAGVVMLALAVFFPRYAFGFVWLCVTFMLDPINNLARRKSSMGHLLAGDWRFFVTLPLAALCCGFFWEMWNFPALPQWYYTVPFVDGFPHLFEMPLPGYLGYLPFGLELFEMYQFGLLVIRRREDGLAI